MNTFDESLPWVVTAKVIRVADMVPWVHRRRFERCAMVGPPPALLSGCYIEGSRWLGLSDKSFIVVPDPTDASSLPSGTVSFVECTFQECEFINFTAVGGQEQIAALRELFPLAR
jgi:hypothetical protein